jgi:D-ribose pyranase
MERGMKKSDLINQPVTAVIATLGHTDTLTIADAGLPIPATTQRIDLALTRGVPSFWDTLRVVLSEMHVEKAIIAQEMQAVSPQMYTAVFDLLGDIPVEIVPHVEFKRQTAVSHAIIRTGEFTPYANIILVAGAWGFDLG